MKSEQDTSTKQSHRLRRTAVTRVAEAVKAVSLCHNVTPVYEGDEDETVSEADRNREGNR